MGKLDDRPEGTDDDPDDDPCHCMDYLPEDPDDSLCSVCVCGHTIEEHGRGFFRSCKFNREEE